MNELGERGRGIEIQWIRIPARASLPGIVRASDTLRDETLARRRARSACSKALRALRAQAVGPAISCSTWRECSRGGRLVS